MFILILKGFQRDCVPLAATRGSALQVKAFPLKSEFMNIMSHNAFISAMAFLLTNQRLESIIKNIFLYDMGGDMFKFFKLFGDQYLGFWVLGLLLFAVQEIPYMVMPLFKLENDPVMHMKESSAALDVLEKVMGSLCIALMTFIVNKNSGLFSVGSGKERVFFWLAVTVLLLNFAGWGLYFAGHHTFFVIMFFIVVLPPLYYVFVGLWRSNIILAATGAVFLIVHFAHVWGNLKLDERLS